MMNKFVVFLSIWMIFSCEDVIVKNIESEEIGLQGPPADLNTSAKSLSFSWNELDGASNYQLLVVSPDIKAPVNFLLDTILTDTKFDFQIAVGKYEWCVRGLNSGYKTDYSCRSVVVN